VKRRRRSDVLLDPVDKPGDSRVDAGFLRRTAVSAETNDAVQPPTTIDATHQLTTGVATARVLATLRVART